MSDQFTAWSVLAKPAVALTDTVASIPNAEVTPDDVLTEWATLDDATATLVNKFRSAIAAANKAESALTTSTGHTIADAIGTLTEKRAEVRNKAAEVIAHNLAVLDTLLEHVPTIGDAERAAGVTLSAAIHEYIEANKAAKEAATIKINKAGGLSHADARKILAANGWTVVLSGADHNNKTFGATAKLSTEAYMAARELAGK